MSTILGLINFDGNINTKQLSEKAKIEIKSRPGKLSIKLDNKSFHINSCIHCDENQENNNLFEDNDNYLINFDGRIDNNEVFKHFIDDSELNSDAANVLMLFKYNRSKISELSGCFSFVIYNKKTQLVEAYRDQIGIRPLYFFYNKKYFIYSTDPEIIFIDSLVKKEINQNKIIYYILKGNRYNEETFYKNIYRLRRSNFLRVWNENIEIREYYSFTNKPIIKYNNNAEYSEHFYQLFYEIIKSQILTSDKKASLMLSGGLDTSSITCMAEKVFREENINTDLKTYSITFNDIKKKDYEQTYETNYINDVLNSMNIKSKLINLDYIDVQKQLASIQSIYPEPNYHGNKYMDLAIIKEMKKDNRKVILSGFDGDSVITHGEQYLYELIYGYKFKDFFKQLRLKKELRKQKFSYISSFRSYLIPQIIPNKFYFYKGLLKKDFPSLQTSKFLKKDLWRDLPIYDMAKSYQYSKKNYRNFHLNTMNTNLWEHIFEIQDFDYGREGLEVRYPFMDKRLIDFCLRIPLNQKMQDGVTRFILRNAMKNTIPNTIYKRYNKSILSPYYDYSFEKNFTKMKNKIMQDQSILSELLNLDYVKSLSLNDLNLNESIIFQHIFVLSNWLDSKK